MPVIATAGHVDHGKSTLVIALTGRDPDRWDEEKRRGLTIDLGFAWTRLGTRDVGFVDVPGHERFVKNMLAGVDGADAALFVVAADEGWMPQSEEHLAVLDLIGVDRGVVALTRADLVDEDRLELAGLEVAERLEDTGLDGSEIIPTAAPDGVGIDRLRNALTGILDGIDITDRGRPRLWIDRAFSIGGAGTIVTGTLLGGSIAVGDALRVHPDGAQVRVRGLQVHETEVERALPGNRTAVNLAGADRSELGRGMMLGRAEQWRPTRRFVSALQAVRGLSPGDRGSHHLHAGSGAWPARVRTVDRANDRWIALIETDDPVPLAAGDRLVLREVGRSAVVAGGAVLDPHPARRARAVRASMDRLARVTADPDEVAAGLLAVRGVARLADLTADSSGGHPEGAVVAGELAVSAGTLADLSERAVRAARDFHEQYPFRPGLPVASLARDLGVDASTLAAIAGSLHGLVSDGTTVRLKEHRPQEVAASDRAWDEARRVLVESGATPPAMGDLGLERDALGALLRSGALIGVADFAYLPETLDEIVAAVEGLSDGFTVAEFRDALGITRKHAIPLLEWMDERGITRRQGDGRTVRR
ncbi:MAG TPA: selenocysteine-specific translation elongation factor [Acidimicrobiia bacterium]|nr:selenocysteine-specific translation elongation factor [Acidimicrobiia bacterium]